MKRLTCAILAWMAAALMVATFAAAVVYLFGWPEVAVNVTALVFGVFVFGFGLVLIGRDR